MQRLTWIAAVGGLFVLLVAANAQFWWCNAEHAAQRRDGPGATGSDNWPGGPIHVELAPELVVAGLSCSIGGPGQAADEAALDAAWASLNITLKTGRTPPERSDLVYTLYDSDDLLLGGGRLVLSDSVKANQTLSLTIVDARLRDATRVCIHRQIPKNK